MAKKSVFKKKIHKNPWQKPFCTKSGCVWCETANLKTYFLFSSQTSIELVLLSPVHNARVKSPENTEEGSVWSCKSTDGSSGHVYWLLLLHPFCKQLVLLHFQSLALLFTYDLSVPGIWSSEWPQDGESSTGSRGNQVTAHKFSESVLVHNWVSFSGMGPVFQILVYQRILMYLGSGWAKTKAFRSPSVVHWHPMETGFTYEYSCNLW